MNDNPLGVSQREKSGSITFGKYEYQYHWALCRIIDEQKKSREYALFMELHEDVIFANSLDKKHAFFDFYQVKNITTPKYNTKNVTKVNSKGDSTLGKLINSAVNKPFSDRVSTINLVASCGFAMELVDRKLNLEVISIGDLSDASVKILKSALNKELGLENLPANLRFIIPKLSISDQQDSAIGKIASLVANIFPGSHCNAENIYRFLIDDLHRKGSVHYDYKKWDELLEKKALTSIQVQKAIGTHVSLQDIHKILQEVDDIANELDMSYLQKKSLKKNIERIHINSIGFPSTKNLYIRNSISNILLSLGDISTKKIDCIIEEVIEILPEKVKNKIGNNDDIRNHIVYELIMDVT